MILKTKDNVKFQISDADYKRVSKYRWSQDKQTGYIYTYIKSKKTYLHRFVTNCETSLVVDHLNHDKTDNRRENLKVTTVQQNLRNQTIKSKCSTGYRNIYKCGKDKYEFQTRENNKTKRIGVYDCIGDALDAKIKYWKENFGMDIKEQVYRTTMNDFNIDKDLQDLILETES